MKVIQQKKTFNFFFAKYYLERDRFHNYNEIMRRIFPFRFYEHILDLESGETKLASLSPYYQKLVSLFDFVIKTQSSYQNTDKIFPQIITTNTKLVPHLQKFQHSGNWIHSSDMYIYLISNEQKSMLNDLSQSRQLNNGDEIWFADYSFYYNRKEYSSLCEQSGTYHQQLKKDSQNHLLSIFKMLSNLVDQATLDLVRIYHYDQVILWKFRFSEHIHRTRYLDTLNFLQFYFDFPISQNNKICQSENISQIFQTYYQKDEILVNINSVDIFANNNFPSLQNKEDISNNLKCIWNLFQQKQFNCSELLAIALRYPLNYFNGWNNHLKLLIKYYQARLNDKKNHHSPPDQDLEQETIQTVDTADHFFSYGRELKIPRKTFARVLARFYSRYWNFDYNYIFFLYALYQVSRWFKGHKSPLLILDQTNTIFQLPYDPKSENELSRDAISHRLSRCLATGSSQSELSRRREAINSWNELSHISLFYYNHNYQYPEFNNQSDITPHYRLKINDSIINLDLDSPLVYQFGQYHFPLDLENHQVNFHVIILDTTNNKIENVIGNWLGYLKSEGYLILLVELECLRNIKESIESSISCLEHINYLKLDPELVNLGIDKTYLLYQKID